MTLEEAILVMHRDVDYVVYRDQDRSSLSASCSAAATDTSTSSKPREYR